MSSPVSERRIIFLVGLVQFFNILDFMRVMPLGPFFAADLALPESNLGFVGGSYTLAAALSGLLGARLLDRFDRKRALLWALAGLTAGTVAGGFAWDMTSLLCARVVAGLFGGPATSLSLSIVTDVVPAERRGRAMGAVMGAFAAASVLGVPAGLRLASWGGWRTPFFGVAALGLVATSAAYVLLPSLRGHLALQRHRRGLGVRLRPTVLLSFVMSLVFMMGAFSLIPIISPYLINNLGYAKEQLDVLYLIGGVASFFTMRLAGALVDRFGSFEVASVGTALTLLVVYVTFAREPHDLPVVLLFVGFMVTMAPRNVAYNTLASKVPQPDERAAFMSVQSAVQHLAASAGAFLSAALLVQGTDRRLVGMPRLAAISMLLIASLPLLIRLVERRVRSGR